MIDLSTVEQIKIRAAQSKEGGRGSLALGEVHRPDQSTMQIQKLPNGGALTIIIGAAGSGKTNSLHSIVAIAALAREPSTKFYFAGLDGSLNAFANRLSDRAVANLATFEPLFDTVYNRYTDNKKTCEAAGCKHIRAFAKQGGELPLTFFVIDELTDFLRQIPEKSDLFKKFVDLVNNGADFGIQIIATAQKYDPKSIPTDIRRAAFSILIHNIDPKNCTWVLPADYSVPVGHFTLAGLVGFENGVVRSFPQIDDAEALCEELFGPKKSPAELTAEEVDAILSAVHAEDSEDEEDPAQELLDFIPSKKTA